MLKKAFLDEVLTEFNFSETKDFSIIKHQKGSSKFRIVVKVETSQGELLIIRISHDKTITKETLNSYIKISDCFNKEGIKTPKRFKSISGEFYIVKNIFGKEALITVEDCLNGTEIRKVSPSIIKELGKNLGKMHASVEAKGVYAGFDSLSGLFLDKEMQSKYSMNNEDIYLDNFLYFIEKMKQYPVEQTLLNEVWHNYFERRTRLKNIWTLLPKGFVQGDYISNNILLDYNGNITGIIDFHIAGDMVFINDMMNSAIYFDYELNKDNLIAGIRYNVVGQFIEGYQYYRPLSDLEKSAIIDVYSLLSPFLRMKIDKLIETAENSRYEDVNAYIEEILLQFQNSSTAIYNIK